MQKLLEVRNLKTSFSIGGKTAYAVDGIDFHIERGETLAIVGESGSGKSVTALSIMGLVSSSLGHIEDGEVLLEGQDLLRKTPEAMRSVKGREIAMIFQEPMSSLNPVYTCGWQICEMIRAKEKISRREAMNRAVELMRLVGIPLPEKRVNEYPHRLSGGLRQRVMIAMAVSLSPKLLIADEPTTALDVTIQAQILRLMRNLRQTYGMSLLLITHDLGVVAEMAQRVVVMYGGKIVEEAPVKELFAAPLHPYTVGLLNAIPKRDNRRERLYTIPGTVAAIDRRPSGCGFHTRCSLAFERCKVESPPMKQVGDSRRCACFRIEV